MDYLKNFIETICRFMQDRGLNRETLAKESKISRTSFDRWFKGQSFPDVNSIIRVADYMDCSADYIFNLSDKISYEKGERKEDVLSRFLKLKARFGVSDYKISKSCNLSQSSIYRWIKKGQKPSGETAIKLAYYFSCSLDYLLGRSDKI